MGRLSRTKSDRHERLLGFYLPCMIDKWMSLQGTERRVTFILMALSQEERSQDLVPTLPYLNGEIFFSEESPRVSNPNTPLCEMDKAEALKKCVSVLSGCYNKRP